MKKFLFWFLAVVITLGSAYYQRTTGPTYPVRGSVEVDGAEIRFRLPRNAETVADAEVALQVPPQAIDGYLTYKRFKTTDAWTQVLLERDGERLVGKLPRQPAAGKLEYQVVLVSRQKETPLTDEPIVIRFKDPVPVFFLIPHILIMFLGMLFSTRAGLAALDKQANPRTFVLWAFWLQLVGGFVLGPIIQKYAFGVLWSGFPFGVDLTDNKTLISFLFWAAALIAGRKGRPARGWVLAAAVVNLAIYLIPHSVLGSELDYSKLPAGR
ncbi:MAG: hypothetical protein OEW05_07050 [Candidatus Aminicenantes bacterium]|nr:hypothetical protein [Candidatus Aminicenantes bacterium]